MEAKHAKQSPHVSWYDTVLNHILRIIAMVLLSAIALVIYYYFLRHVITGKLVIAFIIVWLVCAYIILPRVYRLLTKILLPNYFIGRTQVGDGLLGDPINLAFNGTAKALTAAMTKAGWTSAAPLSLNSSLKMVYAAVFGKNYPDAPVSSLFLFNKKQNYAFEKDIGGNPRKRHHIRFWKTPDHWWLPGGLTADWLAAATFDENVSLSLFTGQITHKIGSNIDGERDFVIASLQAVTAIKHVKTVEHFTSSYHGRNGGGDLIQTDGALPFITFSQ